MHQLALEEKLSSFYKKSFLRKIAGFCSQIEMLSGHLSLNAFRNFLNWFNYFENHLFFFEVDVDSNVPVKC